MTYIDRVKRLTTTARFIQEESSGGRSFLAFLGIFVIIRFALPIYIYMHVIVHTTLFGISQTRNKQAVNRSE